MFYGTAPAAGLRRHSAFTLIELLVVIAIIAILAAILFPVFAQAREKARQSSCASNMKQLAMGLISYSSDYDELFPLATNEVNLINPAVAPTRLFDVTWVNFTQPYIKNLNIFICPSTKDFRQAREPESTPNADEAGPYTGSITNLTPTRSGPIWDYGMTSRSRVYWARDDYEYRNEHDQRLALYEGVGGWNFGGTGTPKFGSNANRCDSLSQAEVVRPADTALLVESRSWDNGGQRNGDLGPEFVRPRHLRANFVNSQTAPQGWANTAFVDGHVKAMRPEQLYTIITEGGVSYYKHFYGKR
jgi:prepilin-type N-terminal cleavage/methylation domain-containing protein/prepilin-type processing-associated H-X9-DG protein